MFRRVNQVAAARALTTTKRAYTDYHHFNYPVMKGFWFGLTTYIVGLWLFFMSCNSVWWEHNREVKKNNHRSWKRRMGKGYKWADELGPQVESVFRNLPVRAE